jgi:hypothetical protein
VLGVTLWDKQKEIIEAVAGVSTDKKIILVESSNSIGKSFIAACTVNWFFDTRKPVEAHEDTIVLTTAPTERQVIDILWREVRKLRGTRDLKDKAPEMSTSPNHFAAGFTSRDTDSFKGRHAKNMLFVFDEAVGVDHEFFEATETMCMGQFHKWLMICNPTDPASVVYDYESDPRVHVIRVSGFDHPNVKHVIEGGHPDDIPIPSAVTLAWLEAQLRKCSRVDADSAKPEYFEWKGEYYRTTPFFDHACLGRWPIDNNTGVWTLSAIKFAENTRFRLPDTDNSSEVDSFVVKFGAPEIGIDVAQEGDDKTVIMARWGRSIIHYKAAQGWKAEQISEYAKGLSRELSLMSRIPTSDLPIKYDKTGVGYVLQGVPDFQTNPDYRVIPIIAQGSAVRKDRFANKRAEMWMNGAELAERQQLEWSRLDQETKRLLRRELLAVQKKAPDGRGRIVIQKKQEIKKELGESPDSADSLNITATNYFRPETLIPKPEAPAVAKVLSRHQKKYPNHTSIYGSSKSFTAPRSGLLV